MKKYLFVIVSVLLVFTSEAQLMRKKNTKMTNRKHMALVDFKGFRSSGWLVSPGLTYTQLFNTTSSQNLLLEKPNYVYPSKGLGFYLEFGRYHIMYNGGTFINYIDYSVAYKGLGNTHYALANFNANSLLQLSNNTFLQNSLGTNIDFPFSNFGQPTAQIHYKLGMGFKMTKRWFLIPTVEVPFLNVYAYDNILNPALTYDSGFQPFIFSVRMAWLRPIGGLNCGKPKRKKKQKISNQEREAQKRYDNR